MLYFMEKSLQRWPPAAGGSAPRPQVVTRNICSNYFEITIYYLILEWWLVGPPWLKSQKIQSFVLPSNCLSICIKQKRSMGEYFLAHYLVIESKWESGGRASSAWRFWRFTTKIIHLRQVSAKILSKNFRNNCLLLYVCNVHPHTNYTPPRPARTFPLHTR